jgi:hypothetical protein
MNEHEEQSDWQTASNQVRNKIVHIENNLTTLSQLHAQDLLQSNQIVRSEEDERLVQSQISELVSLFSELNILLRSLSQMNNRNVVELRNFVVQSQQLTNQFRISQTQFLVNKRNN